LDQLKHYQFEVMLEGGGTLETTFTQRLGEGQVPASRFYLGYSTDQTRTRDLPWISVGSIGYAPEKALGVRIAEIIGRDGLEAISEPEATAASRNGKRD
jgi:hypothetical protein